MFLFFGRDAPAVGENIGVFLDHVYRVHAGDRAAHARGVQHELQRQLRERGALGVMSFVVALVRRDQPSAADRAHHHHAQALGLRVGHHLRVHRIDQVVLAEQRLEHARIDDRLHDLRLVVERKRDVADQPFLFRLPGLVEQPVFQDRILPRVFADAVLVIEVDYVHAQTFKLLVEQPAVVVSFLDRPGGVLGGQVDAMSGPFSQGPADGDLALAVAVRIPGVHVIHAQLERPVHDGHRFVHLHVLLAVGAFFHGQAHRAEPQRRNLNAGLAKFSVFHEPILLSFADGASAWKHENRGT